MGRRFRATGAPAGHGLAGAFVLALAATGCDRVPGGAAELELDGETVTLPAGAEVVEVAIETDGGNDRFEPARPEAAVGDVVRFANGQLGTHAIAFERDGVGAEQFAFLERTLQLSSPPLVGRDAAWVVSLEEAPPGSYPFRCMTHGARGTLIVR
ncbi:MAG TPA: hypothetical protein VMK65_13865 [Longimicrobiales bacterium]|nr:hypothetical protein [Longimicrobiales bacterium]